MMPERSLPMYGLKATFVLFCVFTAVLLASFAVKSRAAKPSIVIQMMDMPASFLPERETIKVDDTVERKNVGNQLHHVTTDPSAALKRSDVSSPAEAKPFDSGFIKPGESFTPTFSIPETYRYTCAVHENKGMNGELVVQK